MYTPSDAYQESILKPVKSFNDVTIFHYTVPSQTYRATWTFVAFSDECACTERLVHMYVLNCHIRIVEFIVLTILLTFTVIYVTERIQSYR